jgi:hypothetical protein
MQNFPSSSRDGLRLIRTAAHFCTIGSLIAAVGAMSAALLPSTLLLTNASPAYAPLLLRELTGIERPGVGWAACFLLLGTALYREALLSTAHRQGAGALDERMAVSMHPERAASGS